MRYVAITFLFLIASHVSAADFSRFLGTWRFCEAATIALWRSKAKTADERKLVEYEIALLKENRADAQYPLHPDIAISQKAIVGVRTKIGPRYHLLEAEEKQSAIVAVVKAWATQDDSQENNSVITITLQRVDGRLQIETSISGLYVFERE